MSKDPYLAKNISIKFTISQFEQEKIHRLMKTTKYKNLNNREFLMLLVDSELNRSL